MSLNPNIPAASYGTGDAVGTHGAGLGTDATGTPRPIPRGMGALAVTSVGPVKQFEKLTPLPPQPVTKTTARKLPSSFARSLLSMQSAPAHPAPPRPTAKGYPVPVQFKGVVTNIEPRAKAADAPPFPLLRATIGVALIAVGFKEGGPWLLLALAGAALDISAIHKWRTAGGSVA